MKKDPAELEIISDASSMQSTFLQKDVETVDKNLPSPKQCSL